LISKCENGLIDDTSEIPCILHGYFFSFNI
jgi:hypothetical protein